MSKSVLMSRCVFVCVSVCVHVRSRVTRRRRLRVTSCTSSVFCHTGDVLFHVGDVTSNACFQSGCFVQLNTKIKGKGEIKPSKAT